MTTPHDIIRLVESESGHNLYSDEGISFGPRTRQLEGVTVTWCVTEEAIEAAASRGHHCLVHHESLTYFSMFEPTRERHDLSWPANRKRLRLIEEAGLTSIRLHGSIDELYIYRAAAEQLGLGAPIGDDGSGIYCRAIYGSPVPTFGALVDHVKHAMHMNAVRISTTNPDRKVMRIGMPWGGMGLSINIAYIQALIDAGADTLICGETDAWAMRFAVDAGLAVIETSHELSESEGLRSFADYLGKSLSIDSSYVETPCIWTNA